MLVEYGIRMSGRVGVCLGVRRRAGHEKLDKKHGLYMFIEGGAL